MAREFDVRLDLARLNRNSRYVMMRRAWRLLIVVVVLLVLMMVLQFGWREGLAWGVGGGVVVVAVVILLLRKRVSAANSRWVEVSGGTLHVTLTEECLTYTHDTMRSEIRWKILGPIVKLPNDWLLLLYTGNSYVPLPLEQVTEDALIFIESEVAAHGRQSGDGSTR